MSEGAVTIKVEGTGVVINGCFVSRGSEVLIIISINQNIKKEILLFLFSS